MVDLFLVVILRRHPEDRDYRPVRRVQLFGKSDGRDRFRHGEEGAEEQARLLAGNDDATVGMRQALELREHRFGGRHSLCLAAQGIGKNRSVYLPGERQGRFEVLRVERKELSQVAAQIALGERS